MQQITGAPVSSTSQDAQVIAALGKRSVVLVGMTGAGKSSVGRRLAQRLGISFVDADSEVEASAGMTLSEIRTNYSEEEFRSGEVKVIARLLENGRQVLAISGGAFMNPETRAAIRKKGVSVWLKADLDVLLRRIKRGPSENPELRTADKKETLRQLIEDRYPVFSEADITVVSREVSHEQLAAEIILALPRESDEVRPLLDLSDAAVRKMIKLAKKSGFVTYQELNAVISSEEATSEQIEDILAMLNDMGINVVEGEEAERTDSVIPDKAVRMPAQPIPSEKHAARFTVRRGKLTVSKPPAWRGVEESASRYFDAAKKIAQRLREQLSGGNSAPEIVRAIDTLLNVLSTDLEHVQPDVLRLASRTIFAKAKAYSHAQAEWELLPEVVSNLFELADVLRDLQAFVRADLEAHERAIQNLEITPAMAEKAKESLDALVELAEFFPEVVAQQAAAVLAVGRAAHNNASTIEVHVAITGDRVLLAENLGRALAVALANEGRKPKELDTKRRKSTEARGNTTDSIGSDSIQHWGRARKAGAGRGTRIRSPSEGLESAERDVSERLGEITRRTFEVIEKEGPKKWGKAGIDAIEGVIRRSPRTIMGMTGLTILGAYIAPWLGTLTTISGSAGLIAAWIAYRVWRRTKADGA